MPLVVLTWYKEASRDTLGAFSKKEIHKSQDAIEVCQRSGRGFSLIELAVVVAIVLILAGAAVPNILASVERGRAQTAALELAQDLRLVRENAILYQRDLWVYIFTDPANSMWFYCYEQLPRLDTVTGLPRDGLHYHPANDGNLWPDSSRFVRKDIPFGMRALSVSASATCPMYWISGRKCYEFHFRGGKDGNIPGSLESPGSIIIGDHPFSAAQGSHTLAWKVIIDSVGRVRLKWVGI